MSKCSTETETGGLMGPPLPCFEYDFDLESDITGIKDAKLNTSYITKCVLRGNRNYGEISGVKNYTYDGEAKTQEFTIHDGFTDLEQGIDYTVSYKNNKNAGTAYVVIQGKNGYTGTIKKSFAIH